jgi:hypothetical protein
MGRKKKREIRMDLEIGKEAKYRIFVRELRKQGVIASEAFKALCEQGVTFDRAFEIVSEEYGVNLMDLVRWSEEEGWMEEGGWLRKVEEGMGIVISGRLMHRALEGSVAAMKAYLVKWRPDEWSERLKVEQVGESKGVNVMVVLGSMPADLKGKELPGVSVVDISLTPNPSSLPLEAGEGVSDTEGDDAAGSSDTVQSDA